MTSNLYALYLQAAGLRSYSLDGVDWFKYNGFLRPAYLPHLAPLISRENARAVMRMSGAPFARWDQGFGRTGGSSWWYVSRDVPITFGEMSGNTRSKLRRGLKRLSVRAVSAEEIARKGYAVCTRAVGRYSRPRFLSSREGFTRRVSVAVDYPETVEFVGVFNGDDLVGFSENHLQGGGVFAESMWYDPQHLRDYSGYVLAWYLLEYYLAERKMMYVTDGSRSLYHVTNVQTFLQEKFGFSRVFAKLEVEYSLWMRTFVGLGRPLAPLVHSAARRTASRALEMAAGILLQDRIARGLDFG